MACIRKWDRYNLTLKFQAKVKKTTFQYFPYPSLPFSVGKYPDTKLKAASIRRNVQMAMRGVIFWYFSKPSATKTMKENARVMDCSLFLDTWLAFQCANIIVDLYKLSGNLEFLPGGIVLSVNPFPRVMATEDCSSYDVVSYRVCHLLGIFARALVMIWNPALSHTYLLNSAFGNK